MAKNIKKRIIIPPHWATVFLFAAICLLVFYAHAWAKSIESHDLTEKYETYCFGMTVVLISLLFHYGITPKGIVCMFLFIPFRLIKWEDVSTAEYIYEWPSSYRGGIQLKGQGIVVSLTSGPPFAPEVDAPNILRWKHPFSTCWMRFSKAKRKQYVEVFQQYFPELSFQVGCDTSFLENKTACRGDAFQGDGSAGT